MKRQRSLEIVVGYVPQAWQACAGTDRSKHETRYVFGGVFVSCLPRDFGGAAIDLRRLILQVELCQCYGRATEAVGLDDIRSGPQISVVHLGYQMGS